MKTPTQNTFAPLDTYPADLLNETPPRREEVTEIQDREAGELLCYSNPKHAQQICRAVNAFPAIVAALETASLYLTGPGRHCAQVADEHAQAESGAAILAGNAQTRELESVIADVEAARALLGSDQSARDALLLYTFQLPARISLRSHKSAVLDVAGNVLAMFDEGEDEARQARELCRVLNAAHRAGIVENATEDSGQ